MVYLRTVLEILVAFLAVVGLYFLIGLLLRRCWKLPEISCTLEIFTEEDADRADILIQNALSEMWFCPSERLIVLTLPQLCNNSALCGAVLRYGVECLTVKENEIGQ